MFIALRKNLIAGLKSKGIANTEVLDVMLRTERHLFIPEESRESAYIDHALPIGEGQTISQPYTVAFMTELLDIHPGDKVLEIGTGSGYQSAILYNMGADVFTVERNEMLYKRCKLLFASLGMKIGQLCDDGTKGWPEEAPFDAIIVTAGAPEVPGELKSQLKTGGRLVIPVGNRNSQSLLKLIKTETNRFEIISNPGFVFVPLIGKDGWKTE